MASIIWMKNTKNTENDNVEFDKFISPCLPPFVPMRQCNVRYLFVFLYVRLSVCLLATSRKKATDC